MFERFTTEARMAVTLAQDEARALHHHLIGTEHVLIGLAGAGDDPASHALRNRGVTAADLRARVRNATGTTLDPAALATLGIDLAKVRQATEERFGVGALDPDPQGPPPKGHIRFGPRAKTSLEFAVRAAVSMHSGTITSGHLLLGIIDEGEGLGVKVLRDAGVDVPGLRAETVALIAAQAA